MSQEVAGRAAKGLVAMLFGLSAACAVAADDAAAVTKSAPTVAKAAAETDKGSDGGPTAWVVVLAGVGVVGWAALRRLGSR